MAALPPLIIWITPGFAASEADSSCLPLQQALLRAFRNAAGYDVAVLALHYPFRKEPYTWHGINVYPFNGRNRGGPKRWLRALAVQRRLEQLHQHRRIIGIVSCWYGEAAALGSAFARQERLSHYCWLLGQDARAANPWPRRLRLPASELVALSSSVADTFRLAHGRQPAHRIAPGVVSFAASGQPRRIDLLGVGSLIGLKRWTVFLQVVARLRTQQPELRAMLIGTGPAEPPLRAEAEALGLSGTVLFAGELAHEAVLRQMAQARVLLHPSEYEGYSGVCQEALSVGTPVVSCCHPGDVDSPYWLQGQTVAELEALVLPWLLREGISPQPFPIEDTARAWLQLLQTGSAIVEGESSAISPRAIAAKEK